MAPVRTTTSSVVRKYLIIMTLYLIIITFNSTYHWDYPFFFYQGRVFIFKFFYGGNGLPYKCLHQIGEIVGEQHNWSVS